MDAVMTSVELPEPLTEAGLKFTPNPGGSPVRFPTYVPSKSKVTLFVKSVVARTLMLFVTLLPAGTVWGSVAAPTKKVLDILLIHSVTSATSCVSTMDVASGGI